MIPSKISSKNSLIFNEKTFSLALNSLPNHFIAEAPTSPWREISGRRPAFLLSLRDHRVVRPPLTSHPKSSPGKPYDRFTNLRILQPRGLGSYHQGHRLLFLPHSLSFSSQTSNHPNRKPSPPKTDQPFHSLLSPNSRKTTVPLSDRTS